MATNFFRIKKGVNIEGWTNLSSVVLPEEADLAYELSTHKYKYYSGSLWKELGGGGSGINYITNWDAEGDTSGWITYSDAITAVGSSSSDLFTSASHGLQTGDQISFSSISPASGTGISVDTLYYVVNPLSNTFQVSSTLNGVAIDILLDISNSNVIRYKPIDATPTASISGFTFSTSATNPLRGLKSFFLNKNNQNHMGHGISCDFTIDAADTNSELKIELDSETSANFVEGDIGVYIFDVTNNKVIKPNTVNIKN
jgi:hypothetical protein